MNKAGFFLIALVFTPRFVWAQAKATASPYTVCDTLKHLFDLDGQVITVIGQYSATPEEKSLIPVDGKACTEPFSAGGRVWLDAIDIEDSGFDASTLSEGVRSALAQIRATPLPQRRELRIVETLSGRISAPKRFTADNYGRKQPLAFGHMGEYPAHLTYSNILSVQVGNRP